MWDWVGGRFSLWSAVGLTISLAVGYDNFEELLEEQMKWIRILKRLILINMPVILALLSVWYNNFFGAESEALIPYTQYLQKLAPYLQQGTMEVMAKVGRDGKPVQYQTGLLFGASQEQMLHTFFS
jgi:glucose-6-phosphate isomerase